MFQKAGDQTGIDALRKRILARMWDVSAFIRWSGYAEAMAGKPKAQEGLRQAGADGLERIQRA